MKNMTLEEWKAYLANQYELGTPVTVWYVLENPEEFQTEPQPLIQPNGSGTIIQIDGTVNNCPITVTPVTHS